MCIVFSECVCFAIVSVCVGVLSSPDGSYTEESSSEPPVKPVDPEFDEFEEEETLPTIGTCKALYPFDGNHGIP